MKVIIAGSRHIEDYSLVLAAIQESGFDITHVVSGGAKGVDTLAERYAKDQELPITIYPAQWKKFAEMGQTKAAGHARNKTMAENADALIAIWDGASRGTANMVDNAKRLGLRVFIKTVMAESPPFKKFELLEPNFRRKKDDVQDIQSRP